MSVVFQCLFGCQNGSESWEEFTAQCYLQFPYFYLHLSISNVNDNKSRNCTSYYRSDTVNSNTVNSNTVNSKFHLIRSKTVPTNDFELTVLA